MINIELVTNNEQGIDQDDLVDDSLGVHLYSTNLDSVCTTVVGAMGWAPRWV